MSPPQATSKVWSRPLTHPEFFIPGVTLFILGIEFMATAMLARTTHLLEDGLLLLGGALALVTGILVARRTRLGTAFLCLLLLGSAVARVATSSLANTPTGWMNDVIRLLIFVSLSIHLRQQIAYHRARWDQEIGRDLA